MFTIDADMKGLEKQLGRFARKQLPFATSRAINDMAKAISERERSKLDRYFADRTGWIKKKGSMPVVKSHKRQWPDVTAEIGVRSGVMALRATGGYRKGGSKDMAVPFSNTGTGKSTREELNPSKETLTAGKWPKNIVKKKKGKRTKRGKKPKPFYFTSKKRNMIMVGVRLGKARKPMKILYSFKKSVDVAKKWPLQENVARHVGRTYDIYLQRWIMKAINDAK